MNTETYLYDAELQCGVYRLPAVLTIETIEAQPDQMIAAIKDQPMGLTLDASQVAVLTTPGAQLLLSLAASQARHGGTLAIAHPTQIFTDALTDLGLGAWLAERKVSHA